MPRKPEWFHQVSDALERLESYSAPVVDRAGIEDLLRVNRRDAIRLMHRFGGYQSGKAFLISKADLAAKLKSVAGGDSFTWEATRRRKLEGYLTAAREELRTRGVRLAVSEGAWQRDLADLPDGIRLGKGRLEVRFDTAEQMLGLLFELAQAVAGDLERFRAIVEEVETCKSVQSSFL